MISPVQERIPIYLAAIGPEEHRARRRDRRRLDADASSRPSTSPSCGRCSRRAPQRVGPIARRLRHRADRQRLRLRRPRRARATAMRPFLALYVGGMGSRKQNFYNQLVRRYGFEDAAARGPGPLPRRQEGGGGGGAPRRADRHWSRCAARPTSCASGWPPTATPASARSTSPRWRSPPTSGSSSCGSSPSSRPEHGRPVARRFFLGAFGDPGHAFPMIALGARWRARGHEVTLETWSRWQASTSRPRGWRSPPAPEYDVFPTGGPAASRSTSTRRSCTPPQRHGAARRASCARTWSSHDILTLAPALAGELEGIPVRDADPPSSTRTNAPDFPIYCARRAPAAHGGRPRRLAPRCSGPIAPRLSSAAGSS